jgi:hypothetical protein
MEILIWAATALVILGLLSVVVGAFKGPKLLRLGALLLALGMAVEAIWDVQRGAYGWLVADFALVAWNAVLFVRTGRKAAKA